MHKIVTVGRGLLSISLAGCLLTGVVGCNSTSTPDARSYGVRKMDRQQIATPGTDANKNVTGTSRSMGDRDTLMGRNANPNLVIGHQDVQNTGVDIKNMQMMAKSVPGVENARITVSGVNAFVTLDLVHNVTANQARSVERQVIQKLSQKAPRYNFHITSNDGYHR
ncbi:sporulation protein [Brevibacillus ginsengisoli]|uniref:sporulation protein n=1 Tax=Brevibacillus ginsengisoli TaxID=363854 RepID=UPI003CEF8BE3